ncbi:ATP-binding protein [Pseudomonas sp.]|uniref:ATP-binding protein n=1 Tax=Pseudomonas sp. TaxID=306 RepID=UPI0019D936DB|nr:ATP-binding protein [Pseudomonas sp.]MBF0673881.1 sensor histidine kinase N-terminal domain-containing protein [Pseudomonas sp.]
MSLRLRLSLILGTAFLLLWSLAAAWMLYDLRDEMMRSLDQRLASSARMVAGLIAQVPQPVRNEMHERRLSAEQLGIPNGLTCQVSSLRGEILSRSHSTPDRQLDAGGKGFRTQVIEGIPWRSFTLIQDDLRITTADRIDERTVIEHSIWLSAAVPVGLALLGSLMILWLGIAHGLAPLQRIRDALTQRGADDLQPLQVPALPSELRPLVASQNQLLRRIAEAVERERSLTDNAAHELRSPLTAIKTHLQVARMTEGATAAQALAHAEEGANRLQCTLEQLLLLARLDGNVPFDDGLQCNAADIARLAIEDVSTSHDTPIILHLGEDVSPAPLDMPPSLAITALRNLLENAVRHTAPGTSVELQVEHIDDTVDFTVRDHGPGIADEHLQHLTQRFWRHGKGGSSGLGLAIVQAIAQRCGCSLSIANGPGGLSASLTTRLRRQT